MATYSVSASQMGAWEKTLAANVVDTITFAYNLERVTVINEGAAGVYFTANGSTPAVKSSASLYCPPQSAVTLSDRLPVTVPCVIKIVAGGASKYSVTGAY